MLKNKKNLRIVVLFCLVVCLSCIIPLYAVCEPKFVFPLTFEDPFWGEGGILALVFAKSVEEMTNGDVKIEIYSDDEWGGGEESYLENVQLGTMPMTLIATSSISAYTSVLSAYDTPFLFRNIYQQMDFTFDSMNELSPSVEKLLKHAGEEAKCVFLALTPMGRRDIFSNKPINSIDDLKNLKIRTMLSPIQVKAFEALGANVTPLAYGETYTGLQLKTIDAMENSPSIYMQKRYFEVAPYWMGTRHYAVTMVLTMSNKAWESLPQNYQAIIKDCAVRSAYIDGQWAIGNAEISISTEIPKVTKKMILLSNEEQNRLREKALPVLLEEFGDVIGYDILEELAAEDELIKGFLDSKK